MLCNTMQCYAIRCYRTQAPKTASEGARRRKRAPRRPKTKPRGPQEAPRGPQSSSKRTPRGPQESPQRLDCTWSGRAPSEAKGISQSGCMEKDRRPHPLPCLDTLGDKGAKGGQQFFTARTKTARSSMHLCTSPARSWRGGGVPRAQATLNTRSALQGKARPLLTRAWGAAVGVPLAARLSFGVCMRAVVTFVVHPLAVVVRQVDDVEAEALLAWIHGATRASLLDRVVVTAPARIIIEFCAVVAGGLHPLATRGVRALHVQRVRAVRVSALQVGTRRVACLHLLPLELQLGPEASTQGARHGRACSQRPFAVPGPRRGIIGVRTRMLWCWRRIRRREFPAVATPILRLKNVAATRHWCDSALMPFDTLAIETACSNRRTVAVTFAPGTLVRASITIWAIPGCNLYHKRVQHEYQHTNAGLAHHLLGYDDQRYGGDAFEKAAKALRERFAT